MFDCEFIYLTDALVYLHLTLRRSIRNCSVDAKTAPSGAVARRCETFVDTKQCNNQ